jgi:hypothetical protein
MIAGEFRLCIADVGFTIYGPEDCPAIFDTTGVVAWHATEPVANAALMFTFGDRVLILEVDNAQQLEEFASSVWQANELLGRMFDRYDSEDLV